MDGNSRNTVTEANVSNASRRHRWGLITVSTLFVLMAAGAVAWWAYYVLLPELGNRAAEALDLTLFASDNALVGEPYDLYVVVHNAGQQRVAPAGIWISKTLLSDASITSINPDLGDNLVEEQHGFLLPLRLTLQPGQTRAFSIRIVPSEPGIRTGEIRLTSRTYNIRRGHQFTVLNPVAEVTQESNLPTPAADRRQIKFKNPALPMEAIVKIESYALRGDMAYLVQVGSGVIMAQNGTILTSAAVIQSIPGYDIGQFRIYVPANSAVDSMTTFHAEVFQVDTDNDLALLRITADAEGRFINADDLNFPVITLGTPSELIMNTPVTLAGFTTGDYRGSLKHTYISAVGKAGEVLYSWLPHPVEGSFSGGAVLNASGELIGYISPTEYKGADQYGACKFVYDGNGDGLYNNGDPCFPTMGKANSVLSLDQARWLIDDAAAFEVEQLLDKTETFREAPAGTVMYENDFSESMAEMEPEKGSLATLVSGGNLLLSGNQYSQNMISFGKDLRNSETSVAVSAFDSPDLVGGYGVYCRMSAEAGSYAVLATETGLYSIIYTSPEMKVDVLYDWQNSDLIPKMQPFTLTAHCVEDRISVAVNGHVLATVNDDRLYAGRSGLLASNGTSANFTAAFRNLVIKTVEAEFAAPSG